MTAEDLTRITGWLLWASTGAFAALGLRLWITGLFRRYPFFFAFVVFRILRTLVLAVIPIGTNRYGYVWSATLPITWILYVLILLELYGLVLESYKGLATIGRWALMVALALSIAISSLSLGADLSTPSHYPVLRYATVIDRGVQSSLVLFLLFITAFLAWYPVKLSRNTIVHCVVYAAYFLTGASGTLIRNFWQETAMLMAAVNLGLTSATLLCLIAWIIFLRPQGELVTVAKRPQWSAEDEAHLMSQLSSINASLLRAARK